MLPIRRLLRTATFRLAALYLLVFAASAVVLGAAVFVATRSALEQQMAARIETEASFLHDEFAGGGMERLLAAVRSRGQGAGALDYLVVDASGRRLAGEIAVTGPLRPGWITVEVPETQDSGGPPERLRALVSPIGSFMLVVGDDLSRVTEVEEAIANALLGAVGLAALLGIGGGAWLSRAFLARVDAISRTAEAIIDGDLTRRVPVRGTGDDLDRLAGTLNHMLDRIAALMASLHQVSSDVAHDLRTPLARLCQRLEDARTHARSVADYETAVDSATREAEGLLQTFSALLRIAQVEGASPRAGFRDVDLGTVVDTVVDAYRPDAEEAGHQLLADIAAPVVIHGDQELLTQATANLVENALSHTPAGTQIVVRLRPHRVAGNRAAGDCLIVEDDGPGVDADDLPRIAGRFYRAERSRTKPGNGLGLSLVAAVAELHEATLQLEHAEPGLRVTLCFPPPGRPARGVAAAV